MATDPSVSKTTPLFQPEMSICEEAVIEGIISPSAPISPSRSETMLVHRSSNVSVPAAACSFSALKPLQNPLSSFGE